MAKMFSFPTSQTHFYFDGKIFDQVEVAIGSLLGPVVTNFFMGFNEQKLLEYYHDRLAKFNSRHVDDIFLFENEHQPLTFVNLSNSQSSNLKKDFRKRTFNTILIFGCSHHSIRQINYQSLQ